MAQSWLVWTMTGSPFLLGVVGFCQAVPRLLLGAVGGAIVDRLDRRRLLLTTQILAMLQAFCFWVLVYRQLIQFWHLLGACPVPWHCQFNQSNRAPIAHQRFSAARRPDERDRAQLVDGQYGEDIGPSIGGILISVIGVAGCLFVNAVSFLAIIVTLLIMEIPKDPHQNERR